MRLPHLAVTVATGLFAVAAPVHGQAGASRTLELAAGLDAEHTFDGGTFAPGFTGQLAISWRGETHPLGARVGVFGFHRRGTADTRMRVYGVEGLGTYALAATPSHPYLLAGVGLYDYAFRAPTGVILGPSASGYRFAASAGVGVAFPAGRVQPFLEARLMVFLDDNPLGQLLPVQVGLRF